MRLLGNEFHIVKILIFIIVPQHTTKGSPTARALEIDYISRGWLISLNDNYEYKF